MEPKTPQLTAYDLLGYLVPGLAFIAFADLSIAFHLNHINFEYAKIIERYRGVSWGAAIPLMLLAYYLGHIISFLSSYTLERHARWIYGAPSKVLLGEGPPCYFFKPFNFNWAVKLAIAVFMFPILWIELLGKLLKLRNSDLNAFDDLVKDMVNKAHANLFYRSGLDFSKYSAREFRQYDYERLGLHYALESAPAHLFSLRNYVVLYGFLRSMSFVFLLICWTLIFHYIIEFRFDKLCLYFLSVGIFCFISYAAFLKFWFRYYRESMMAVTAIFLKNAHPDVDAKGFREGEN